MVSVDVPLAFVVGAASAADRIDEEAALEMIRPLRLNSGQTINHGLAWFMDSFNGHPFLMHWGATAGGFSAVIRRYVDDRLTVIMLANLEDGAFGVDAISKRVAGLYVPGVDWRQLRPGHDTDAALTAKLKENLRPEDARDLPDLP